jgi:hypothetical protein
VAPLAKAAAASNVTADKNVLIMCPSFFGNPS